MKIFSFLFLIPLFFFWTSFAQQVDTTQMKPDSAYSKNQPLKSLVIKNKPGYREPSLPPLSILSEKKQSLHFDVRSQYSKAHPEESTNFDALNKPGSHLHDIPQREMIFKPNLPFAPLEVPQKPFYNPLPLREYVIPTRQEIDLLEILWAKEDVMDTTIYSCLDTTIKMTFMDLKQILDGMVQKGLVSRRIVSPRNEFNLFGWLIEMSPTNVRNRIYEYHSNVDRELMRKFVDANAFLYSEDESIVNLKQLRAAQKDSTLLRDLNRKLNQPNK